MNHIGTKTIETKRLILRKFTPDDVKYLFKNWAADADAVKFMRMPVHNTIEDTNNFVDSIIRKYDKPDTYRWVTVLKEINEPIGFIGLTTVSEHDRIANFGYSIGKPYWNKGYTTEALTAVLRYGLTEAG